jgi:hypothetical protein
MEVNKSMIVAFLQNLWAHDTERVKALLENRDEQYRRQIIKQLLFAGGLTGRRLRSTFGNLCEVIVWEEASREIAGNSHMICQPEPAHIQTVIDQLKPDVVIAFGRVAGDAVATAWPAVIRAPHPAARQAGVVEKLRQIAAQLR